MAQWMTRKVRVALPIELMLDMFLRADHTDPMGGGRYEGCYDDGGAVLLIWPAIGMSGELPAGPHGEADFHWRIPFDGEVTLYRIGWDPNEGGSEALVWEALDVLTGQAIRPDAL